MLRFLVLEESDFFQGREEERLEIWIKIFISWDLDLLVKIRI